MDSILQELGKVWSRLEGAGVMRASLFNLIIVSSDNERLQYLKQITHKVIERFPCRILQIVIGKKEGLTVHVSAATAHGIACDVIEIETDEANLAKIPLLILPHFLPDLPIYLLWAQDPSAYPSLHTALQKWASRCIYDSETAEDLLLFAQTLQKQTIETSDLNWARIASWRELLAATFYSEARLQSLRRAKTFEIHYNALETPFFCHTKIQAIYLIAWIMARLQISPQVSFHPQKREELPPGAILSLEIVCEDQNHFSFHRDSKRPDHVRSIICDEEKCDIPSLFILSKTQARLSLASQIYHSDPSSHFPEVLNYLKEPLCPLLMPN